MQTQSKTINPMLWVPSGYFTMALMYNLLTGATALMFSNVGMDNAKATAYAGMLGLAYTLKPFFAPFLEMYRTKKFFVLLTQAILGFGLFAVAAVMQLPDFIFPLLILLWILSFVGSSQDIASDGIYVTSLDAKSQANYTGVQSFSWNMGRLAILSGLVVASGFLHESVFKHDPHVSGPDWVVSWQIVIAATGVWYLLMALWHFKTMPDGSKAENPPRNVGEAFATLVDAFITFFMKRDVWLMIGFAFLYRLSYGFLNAITPLFLKDTVENGGLAMSNQDIGIVYGTYGIAANVIGSILGGLWIARSGLKNVLFILCCMVNVPNITFLFLAMYQPESQVLVASLIVIEQFFFGVGSVGFMIYMMQQLAPGKYTTAHFAFGTALMGLCMMLTGMASGTLQEHMGYMQYFIFVMVATIPSFIITWLAPFHNTTK
jgi:MFS transporter, PAT family, beta-lactamase induction signal transducer AmpG